MKNDFKCTIISTFQNAGYLFFGKLFLFWINTQTTRPIRVDILSPRIISTPISHNEHILHNKLISHNKHIFLE